MGGEEHVGECGSIANKESVVLEVVIQTSEKIKDILAGPLLILLVRLLKTERWIDES